MDNLDPVLERYWSPSLSNNILSENHNHTNRSWDPGDQTFQHYSPLRRTLHPSSSNPRNEAAQSLVANAVSPSNANTTNRTPPQYSLRNLSHLDLPNFPLPRPYHESLNPERLEDDNYSSLGRETVGSPLPLQLPSIGILSSNDHTPVSRPVSRLSWQLEPSAPSFPSWPAPIDEGFVDLTAETSSPIMPVTTRKQTVSRACIDRSTSATPTSSAKRRKVGRDSVDSEPQEIAKVDLRDINDDDELAVLLEQQRKASIKAQQEEADKPINFSTLQCIICMELMTDITVTHCGKVEQDMYICGSKAG